MEIEDVIPPGEHHHDPAVKELDPVAWAVSRAIVQILWAEEHSCAFQAKRTSDPDFAEAELRCVPGCHKQALKHLRRLAELLLAGYSRDPAKRVPGELFRHLSMLEAAEKRLEGKAE